MMFDISVKIKELGNVQGAFLKATKNSIYIKNALMSRASTTTISLFKVDRRYVISVDRMSAPAFGSFTDSELAFAMRTAPRYEGAIREVQAARSAQHGGASSSQLSKSAKQSGAEQGGQVNRAAGDRKASSAKKGRKNDEWDQFEANSKLFGVSPVFDMNEYAAPIDTSSTTYKSDLEKSARIASEIMSQKTDDAHRLEERGAVKNGDASDERLFSTVRDSGRWDRKGPLSTAGDLGKNSEGDEKIITIPSKSTKESTMEEELNKKKEEVISETNNENPDSRKMWASLKQFLSLKKRVEDSTNAVPPPEPKAVETTPTPERKSPSVPSEQTKNKQLSADRTEPKSGGGYAGPHKDGKADRDTSRGYKPNAKDGFVKPAYKNYKKQDDSSDLKTPKQVIIGSALRYKSADEFIGRIISKFVSPNAGAVKESWGAGCMIEDKIEYIKKKQMCILPSEQRLSEILSFALYRNKK